MTTKRAIASYVSDRLRARPRTSLGAGESGANAASSLGWNPEVPAPPNSNFDDQARSATNVNVRAGVLYPGFRVHALTGLGQREEPAVKAYGKPFPSDLPSFGVKRLSMAEHG